MGDISVYLAALGVWLQIPQTMDAIVNLTKSKRKELTDDSWSKLQIQVQELRATVSEGTQLQLELASWKTIHDYFTRLVDGCFSRLKDEIFQAEDGTDANKKHKAINAKAVWEHPAVGNRWSDFENYAIPILSRLKKEQEAEELLGTLVVKGCAQDYERALDAKNKVVDLWAQFPAKKDGLAKELEKSVPDLAIVMDKFQILEKGTMEIISAANVVLISLLGILNSTFSKVGSKLSE